MTPFPTDPLRGVVQLPVRPFSANWQACSCLKPAKGIVYVEMSPYEEKRGELFLSDETKQRDRADCGVVLACGYERGDDIPPRDMEVRPGDVVLVEPYRGTWLQNCSFGDYAAEGWVRVYGLASGSWDEVHETSWNDAIMAVIDEYQTKTKIKAVGKWLFIERDVLQESVGGVLLTDRGQKQSGMATVLSAGAEAQKQGFEEGQRIQFPPGLSYDAGLYDVSHAKEFGLDSENCSFLDFRNVLSVIE